MKVEELVRLGEAVARVLLDSEQTAEIHVAEELTGRGAFRRIRGEQFAGAEGAALLRARPELCSEQVDFEALRVLAPETLGHHYVTHLDRHGLSADSQARYMPRRRHAPARRSRMQMPELNAGLSDAASRPIESGWSVPTIA